MNPIAESYVKLVLAVGQHDPNYVDAYYGPPEWREKEKSSKRSLNQILKDAAALKEDLRRIDVPETENLNYLRKDYLIRQLQSLESRVRFLRGDKMRFDEEAYAIYGVKPPHLSDAHFLEIVNEISTLLPGEAELPTRYEKFIGQFAIRKDKLSQIMDLAIDECRKRTRQFLTLPATENFKVDYVSAKPWGAYNWYKGKYYSLIQVNTERAIYIDGPVRTAAHEGYPGHHIYNLLLEKNYLRERSWVEFSVYALYSPQSLVAEGSANYGIELLFETTAEREEWEKKHLFPLARLDVSQADLFYRIQRLTNKLNYASNEAARAYLDGNRSKEETVKWLILHAMQTPDRAKRQVDFIETYRSYVINYNYGEDLVKKFVEDRVGKNADRAQRWEAFAELISSPRLLRE